MPLDLLDLVGDEPMTDARLPDRWVAAEHLQSLSDAGYRLYGNALMWSVLNGTDGKIAERSICMIPFCDHGRADELVASGAWKRARDGWTIVDFAKTQTTSDELDKLQKIRKAERDKKARQRAERAVADLDEPVVVPGTFPGTAQERTGESESDARRNYPHPVVDSRPDYSWGSDYDD